jgi:hypothetical protein
MNVRLFLGNIRIISALATFGYWKYIRWIEEEE